MKKVRGRNFKSYCNSICTNCNSLFFVKSANRYCYEDKFKLQQVPSKMLYKKNNKVNTVATGVIGHATYKGNGETGKEVWEENINSIITYNNDNTIYILKEACKEFDINYSKFVRKLKAIYKEVNKI